MAGHRQLFTELFIKSITTPEGQKAETEKTALIIDPVKIQARKDANAKLNKERRHARAKAERAGVETAAAPKKTAAKKKTAKKASAGGAKKSAAKGATKKAATKTAAATQSKKTK